MESFFPAVRVNTLAKNAPSSSMEKITLAKNREEIDMKMKKKTLFLKKWRPRRLIPALELFPGKYDREPLDIPTFYLFF